jgi:hypothetical protein
LICTAVRDAWADGECFNCRIKELYMGLILLILIVLLLCGALPRWGYSRNWGYGPTGGLGFVLLIVLVLVLMGYVPRGF